MEEYPILGMMDALANLDWQALMVAVGDRVLRMVGILAFTWAALSLVHRLLPRALKAAVLREQHGTDGDARPRLETLTSVALRAAEVVLVGTAVLMILQETGFAIAPLVAGLSVIGVALGFGLQSLVRDVVGGVFILAEDQFHKGDIVQIASLRGTVEDVNLRRTVLRDLDGTVHSIPNGQIAISSNFTREWARADVDLRLRYTADLARARAVVDQVGHDMFQDHDLRKHLIAAPHWERIEALEDSAVVVRVTANVRPRRQLEVAGELRQRLLAAFLTENMLAATAALPGAAPAAAAPGGTPATPPGSAPAAAGAALAMPAPAVGQISLAAPSPPAAAVPATEGDGPNTEGRPRSG